MMVLFAASLLVDLFDTSFWHRHDDFYVDLEVPEDCFWVAESVPPGYREGAESAWTIEDLLVVQPPPVLTDRSEDITRGHLIRAERMRSAQGVRRYGTTLHSFNGRDAVADAFQEAVDGMMYCRQQIEEHKCKELEASAYSEVQAMRKAFCSFHDAMAHLLRAAKLRKQRTAHQHDHPLD